MSKQAPSISSGVAGPSGLLHLPRLWQKACLAAVDKLHPEYVACGPGLDQMLLDGLGIERDTFLDFITAKRPTYPQLESWVDAQGERGLDSALVNQINQAVAACRHRESVRSEILNDCGIAAEGVLFSALSLNDLDDWGAFYRDEIAGA